MAITTVLQYLYLSANPATLLVTLLASLLWTCIYRLFFHPLSKVPGPPLAACTSLWLAYHTYVGDECTVVHALHKKHGPVLRVGPNDVDISDGEAVAPIYLDRGGFQKARAYSKFDIDGRPTIFSTLTTAERAHRAKAVVPLFSTAAIRNSSHVLSTVVDEFVARLQREARTGRPVNVLNLTRCMAVDAVSSYLFQRNYGGIAEDASEMSASAFVDAYVGVGAFFNIPGKIGDVVMHVVDYLTSTERTAKSFKAVDDYVHKLIGSAAPGSYPRRLLERSVAKDQTMIECKDLIFAGSDSTGMNTATILWYLARNPDVYARLRQEVLERKENGEDVSAGPYLRGVVREGLRLSWANPIRLPRVVPEGGWSFKGFYFPPGTNVGVSSWELHRDERVFPDADRFLPERWLDPTDEMLRNFFAFGKGSRACIAQNLGSAELALATQKVAEADALKGARALRDKIEIYEWFNSRVKDERIELVWDITASG
ncbi:cytochrome P450 [Thermoascus aurantiacus ATCC 26904]